MRSNREYQVYKTVSAYLRMKYPKVLFHFDLTGVNLSKAAAGMNKAIQYGKGWPDLIILHPVNKTVLLLEIKAEGTKIINRSGDYATPHIQEQASIMAQMYQQGYTARFAVGIDECIANIDYFLI